MYKEFERIVELLLQTRGYTVEVISQSADIGVDLIATDNNSNRYYIETKFYKSNNITSGTLKSIANKLAYFIAQKGEGSGLVVVNSNVSQQIQKTILEEYGIHIWDRNIIYEFLSKDSIELREQFEQLLLNSQQGTLPYKMFSGSVINEAFTDLSNYPKIKPKYTTIPVKAGYKLGVELNQVPCGRSGWTRYESKCHEILNFLFGNDLTLWEKQNLTDDNLSRFDLICRIASKDDFWNALVSSFNTRFILFEFKNYCDPIGQREIYTTERYLYQKGLRSVGFIIARNGADSATIQAAKGALKEHGKLILILSNDDLCSMANLKDKDESPSDYLSTLLDNWLISLSR